MPENVNWPVYWKEDSSKGLLELKLKDPCQKCPDQNKIWLILKFSQAQNIAETGNWVKNY
jgi:hypothetical protein